MMNEPWRITGRHPVDDALVAETPDGRRVKVRRVGEGSSRWVGPLPLGDGRWEACGEDGSVPLELVLGDGPVPASVARTVRVEAAALGTTDPADLRVDPLGRLLVDGEGQGDPLAGLAIDEDDPTPARAWLSERVAEALRAGPDERPPPLLALEPPDAGATGPDKPALARVAVLMVALGLGTGWWMTPRTPGVTVSLAGAEQFGITCEAAALSLPPGDWTVPAGLGRCRVTADHGSMAASVPLDTLRGRTYRCRVSAQGLRCEQG